MLDDFDYWAQLTPQRHKLTQEPTAMPMNEHDKHCRVWDWVSGNRFLNNALGCTCGFREQVAEERRYLTATNRALKLLGMDEDDWLRTLGIDPEG